MGSKHSTQCHQMEKGPNTRGGLFRFVDYNRYKDFQPHELFELFFDEELCDHVVYQTLLYATYKGKEGFQLEKEELKVFIVILILSGYNPLPSRRLYWQKEKDVRVTTAANPLGDRFEEIMRYVHFSSNENLDGNDKY